MSTAIAKNFQVGSDSTATNNFTIRQPATPDGTVRIANGNSGTTTDLVTVTSAGNVGVGTTSPSYRLQAASAGGVAEIVASNSAGAERIHLLSRSSAGVSYLQSQNSNFLVGTFDNYYTAFITNNTERMRLDTSGNLGLGVTPSAWDTGSSRKAFDISTYGGLTANTSAIILAANTFNNGSGWVYKLSDAASMYRQTGGSHAWFSAASGTAGNPFTFTQAMTLTAGGDLGIGATSSLKKLTVQGSTADRTVEVIDNGSNDAAIMLQLSGVQEFTLGVDRTDNSFRIADSGALGTNDRLVIDSSGNLGIGTSSPAVKTNIVGSAGVTLRIEENSSGNNTRGDFSANSTNVTVGAKSNSPLLFTTNDTERMRLDTSGNLGLGVTPSAWFTGGVLQGASFSISQVSGVDQTAWVTGATQPTYTGSWLSRGAYRATMYQHQTGAHAWFTSNVTPTGAGQTISFTQAMTLDASGNLGINSTSPSTFGKVTVQVAGTTTPTNLTNVGPSSINLYAAANGGSTDSTMGIFGWNSTTGIGSGIGFVRENGSDWGTQIRFYTHPTTTSNIGDITERARIDSSGNFLAGTTTPINASHTFSRNNSGNNSIVAVNTSTGAPYGVQSRFTGVDPNNTSSYYFEAWNAVSGAYRFYVASNGGIYNFSANNSNLSDRREKTNFAPAKDYLDTICAIPVQTFNYIDQNMEEDAGLTLGVVAQDVQAVAPELVTESNWGTKEDPKMRLSIYQTDLQYALMKCIQELKAELDSVKTELALLKGTA